MNKTKRLIINNCIKAKKEEKGKIIKKQKFKEESGMIFLEIPFIEVEKLLLFTVTIGQKWL